MYFYLSSRCLGLAVVLSLVACAPHNEPIEEQEGVLARIGDELIKEDDLRRYQDSIKEVGQPDPSPPVSAYRQALDNLINIKLMALEAEKQGLDDDAELRVRLERVRGQALIETYLHGILGQDITVSEEELKTAFKNHPASQAVKAAHILLATKAEADSVYELVVDGAPFADLARELSLDRTTGENGGALKKYFAYNRVSDIIYNNVWDKEVDEIVPPFRTPRGYEVIKIIGKKEVEFESYRSVVMRQALMDKVRIRRGAHVRALFDSFKVQLHQDNMTTFLRAWNKAPRQPDLPKESLSALLYSFDGGGVSLQEAANILSYSNVGAQLDSTTLADKVIDFGLSDLLVQAASLKEGYGDDEAVHRKVNTEREKWLLKQIWTVELEDKLKVSEEEAKAHYEANPHLYQAPAETVVQEIMCSSAAEATELLKKLQDGADMASLAAEHSLRLFADRSGGIYGIRTFEKLLYKELAEAAFKAPLNELQGPLVLEKPVPNTLRSRTPIEKAYSIFKVLERRPAQTKPFEESLQLSQFYARQNKQKDMLKELSQRLRQEYSGEISINEAAIERYAALFTEVKAQ